VSSDPVVDAIASNWRQEPSWERQMFRRVLELLEIERSSSSSRYLSAALGELIYRRAWHARDQDDPRVREALVLLRRLGMPDLPPWRMKP